MIFVPAATQWARQPQKSVMMRPAQRSSKRLTRAYEVQCETTIKTVLRLEEEDENGVTTIREKEQFSHALNILYADGHIAVLTNDPPPEETDEKTAATDTSGETVPPELRLEEVRDEERA